MAPKAIFKGHTFAFSGRLSQAQKEYEELIRKHGGEVVTSVTSVVTLLLSTEEDVKARPQKVVTALGRKVPIVQEGFVGACVTAKKLLEPRFFSINPGKRKSTVKGALKAPAKKAKVDVPVGTSNILPVIPKSGLADKAGVVEEKIERGFVNGTLAWDVELVLNDPAKGKDKYYNMQLLASQLRDHFWAVQHWGKTGMDGTVHVDGPFPDISSAKHVFRRKYRSKTGNVFGALGDSFQEVDGKYKLLAKDTKTEDSGVWQYYLHNKVDGKKIGWYNYDDAAAKNMEKYWKQLETNAGLDIRIVQSDYFRYEINFAEMIQRNTKSGTRRVIRRVPPGERPSSAAPDKIPEKAEPEAVAPADDPSDEESEGDVDEAGSQDEEDEDEEEEEAATEGEEENKEAGAGSRTTPEDREPPAPAAACNHAAPDGSAGGRVALPDPAGGRVAPAARAEARGQLPLDTVVAEAETVPMDDTTTMDNLPLRGTNARA